MLARTFLRRAILMAAYLSVLLYFISMTLVHIEQEKEEEGDHGESRDLRTAQEMVGETVAVTEDRQDESWNIDCKLR